MVCGIIKVDCTQCWVDKNLQNEDWHAARSYCCQKIRLIRLCLNIERDEISCVPLVAGNVCERKLLYNMLPLSCHGNSVLLHLFTTLGAVFALAIVIISVTVVTVTCNEVYHKTATSLSCLQQDLVIKLQQPYSEWGCQVSKFWVYHACDILLPFQIISGFDFSVRYT